MEPAEQRAALAALIAQKGVTLTALSRLLGRNPAYLQQYLERGTPRLLHEEHRRILAEYLGVADADLGGPAVEAMAQVRQLDVGLSAGPGRLVAREAQRTALLDPALLRQLGVRSAAATIVTVRGDSMEPTLYDGDQILVDADRRSPGAKGMLFALRIEGELLAKRLVRSGGELSVLSDNPAYPPRSVQGRAVEVIGQVVWLSRALV